MILIAAASFMLWSADPLSPEGRQAVQQVRNAITQVRNAHHELPPAATPRERLERLGALDQAGRQVITTLDFSRVPVDDRPATIRAASAAIDSVDQENMAELLQLLPADGWFRASQYGLEASKAAFHIVQHSDETHWRRFLPVFETLLGTGEIDSQQYAKMFDRLAISEGRSQRYGTQFRCDNGKWRAYPIEDVTGLKSRRQTMNFSVDFATYKAHFEAQPSCPQTLSPPPAGMVIDD